jgi:hypothetical protein
MVAASDGFDRALLVLSRPLNRAPNLVGSILFGSCEEYSTGLSQRLWKVG